VRTAKITALSGVKPLPIRWLLEDVDGVGQRIPKGAISIVAGQPGTGKTTYVMAVAAELTRRGDSVLFIGSEDGVQDTVLPRLLAARGNPAHFHALTIDEDGQPDQPLLPTDVPLIEHALATTGAAMLIIDPIGGHVAPEINSHNDQSLRRALIPLAMLVRRRGVACVAIMHQNKGAKEGSPLNSLNGGTAYGGVARSVMGFMRIKGDDPKARCLWHIKANGSQEALPWVTQLTQGHTGDPVVPYSSVVDLSGFEDPGIEWRDLT
jgi:putative DNA primase/helicase